MERVRASEVDSPEEVAKVFNKLVDHINEVDAYNAEVEEYNGETIEEDLEEDQEGTEDA